MLFSTLYDALSRLPTPEFRAVFFKSIGLTLAGLLLVWLGLSQLFEWTALPFIDRLLDGQTEVEGWLGFFASLFAAIALAVGLALLIAPLTALIAGLFLDDVAEIIEREDYPQIATGKAMPVVKGAVLSVKFLGIVILGNLVAFSLLLVPGINLIAFFVVNAYLISREYFQFAAMRYRTPEEANAFRRRHSATIFSAGLVVAAFLSIPLVNLLTPLFAAAFMVHLHMRLSAKDRHFAPLPARRDGASIAAA